MDFSNKINGAENQSGSQTSSSSGTIFRLREAAGQYDDIGKRMIKIGVELSSDPVIMPLKAKWHNAVRGMSDTNCLAKAIVDMASSDSKVKGNSMPLIQAVMSGSFFDAGKMILKLGLSPAEISDIENALGDRSLILKDAAATMAMLSGREFTDPSSALDYAKTQLMSNEKVMSLISGMFSSKA